MGWRAAGGGGGYYGGGSGPGESTSTDWGPGGGGSSYTDPAASDVTHGVAEAAGDGEIAITAIACPPAPTTTTVPVATTTTAAGATSTTSTTSVINVGAGELPFTGVNTGQLAAGAFALIAAGGVLYVGARIARED